MVALLEFLEWLLWSFWQKTKLFEGRVLFGGNVFKNLARCILCNISSMRRSVCSVSSQDETLGRDLKTRREAEFFLANFEVFHLVMKCCVECLILLLKQNDF